MPAPARQSVISPEFLARVGRALYGDNWRSPLARDLGMTERSVRYMLTGERGIHAGIVADLMAIVDVRRLEVAGVLKELQKAVRNAGR